MKHLKIKFRRRGLRKHPIYDIIVSRIVNRNNLGPIEVLGKYNSLYPITYAFINVKRLSYCCIQEQL